MRTQFIVTLASVWTVLCTTVPCWADESAENQMPLFGGRVVDDSNDQPIAGAAVVVHWHAGSSVAVSDQSGRFEIPRAAVPIVFGPSTRVTLSCVAPGYGVFTDVYAAPGEHTVELTARRLMRHDQCFVSRFLRYVRDEQVPELARQINEARGRMELGPIDLRTGEPAGTAGVACPEPEPEKRWGPFSGRVVDKSTGEPIPGATFFAIWWRRVPFPVQAREWFNDARVAVTDRDGHFEIPRRTLPFLSSLVDEPFLVGAAPGYEDYRYFGRWDVPIQVRLQRLRPEHQSESYSLVSTFLPFEAEKGMEREFQNTINRRRSEMGLRAIRLATGSLEPEQR
jgi:hypothetical protein